MSRRSSLGLIEHTTYLQIAGVSKKRRAETADKCRKAERADKALANFEA